MLTPIPRLLICLACLALASGCIVEPPPAPTPAIKISREQAAAIAERECFIGRARQMEPPQLSEARLMTRTQADAILDCGREEGCLAAAQTPDLSGPLVWLVVLTGRWRFEGGPAPTQTPTGQAFSPTSAPVFFERCRVEIDAISGQHVGRMTN